MAPVAMSERADSLRLAQLMELLLAQANARSEAEVVSVAVDHGMRAAKADTCSLYRLDANGVVLELVEHRGTAPELVERVRRLTEADSPDMFASLRADEITWVETPEDYASNYPGISTTLADLADAPRRSRSFWSAPLVVEGRPSGLLSMGFYDTRPFGSEERAFARALANQCGLALERVLQLEREIARHAQYATTLRSIGDAVITTDLQGRVTLMNAVAQQLTGVDEHVAMGQPLDEVFAIFSEEDGSRRESQVSRVLREGHVVGLPKSSVLRRPSGRELPIDDSAALILDASGNAFGVVIVFRDITTTRRAAIRREFLARAGAELASSLDIRVTLATVARLAVPQLADWCTVDLLEPGERATQQVAVAHADPSKLKWGRALVEIYPPDPDALTGVPQVVRSGTSELYPEIPEALLEAGARDAEHLRLIREMKLESAMVVPLLGRDRTLGAISFIYADSGRRYTTDDLAFAEEFARQAAMAIENARALHYTDVLRREAVLANTAKDEFLATISHELRTPLNAILGWTMALRERNPPEDVDQGLAVIERNARRQARLIEDILDVSSIISGKLALTIAPVDIADVVAAAVESVTPAANAKGVSIEVDAEHMVLAADAGRLQQVIWNLLTNAIKFSDKESSVSVRASRIGSDVCLRVVDRGEGIPPHLLSSVFEPFRQADASTTRRHGGLGLGLAIVRQLVTAHGGSVEAKSAGPGRGAELIVTLPFRSASSSGIVQPPSMAMSGAPPRIAPPRLDGLAVLVVDDEVDAREIVQAILGDLGADVAVAASAAEALEALSARSPDVLVSDIGMPIMDGYSLIRAIRAQGALTPAIALTAYAQPEDARKALAAGFQVHLTKPVQATELAAVVANLGGMRPPG